MAVEWSTSNEWILITGGCDGAIRFWDIRRAGCFHVLNQSHTQLGRRQPLLEGSSINKVVFLISYLWCWSLRLWISKFLTVNFTSTWHGRAMCARSFFLCRLNIIPSFNLHFHFRFWLTFRWKALALESHHHQPLILVNWVPLNESYLSIQSNLEQSYQSN